MPVKIVSEGPVRTKRVTCPNCGYELEFTGEDVCTLVDYEGDRYQTIRCPRKQCRSREHGAKSATAISVKWP